MVLFEMVRWKELERNVLCIFSPQAIVHTRLMETNSIKEGFAKRNPVVRMIALGAILRKW
jgi:hypothetical protein